MMLGAEMKDKGQSDRCAIQDRLVTAASGEKRDRRLRREWRSHFSTGANSSHKVNRGRLKLLEAEDEYYSKDTDIKFTWSPSAI